MTVLDESIPKTDSDTTDDTTAIAGYQEWLDEQDFYVKGIFSALVELLGNKRKTPGDPEATTFVARGMGGYKYYKLEARSRELGGLYTTTVAVALGKWIADHSPAIGPGFDKLPPIWESVPLGVDETLEIPCRLSAVFQPGTLHPEHPIGVQFTSRRIHGDSPEVIITAPPGEKLVAERALADLLALADKLNPLRGRVLRAGGESASLTIKVMPTPTTSREDVLVPDDVWAELMLNVNAVAGQHKMLSEMGLASRRGVILVGKPGVGKSQLCACIASELSGEFTTIYVEALAGVRFLKEIVTDVLRLQPAILILEDCDLWVHSRNTGSPGLAELLQALDVSPKARLLTLLTSNDPAGLQDAAAVRNGRVDSMIELSPPTRTACAGIIRRLLRDVPEGDAVDAEAVAARLSKWSPTGADVQEIVRRTVLGGDITTAGMTRVVTEGRWRPKVVEGGQYL